VSKRNRTGIEVLVKIFSGKGQFDVGENFHFWFWKKGKGWVYNGSAGKF
jgi:hypothetical protein